MIDSLGLRCLGSIKIKQFSKCDIYLLRNEFIYSVYFLHRLFFNSNSSTMDEKQLNDLLECSVCLERLDTSNKVLSCQHTFCKKCLDEIVATHKELRCPECRTLVECRVDELPPNVLLMRILEGMKCKSTTISLPKKPLTAAVGCPDQRPKTIKQVSA